MTPDSRIVISTHRKEHLGTHPKALWELMLKVWSQETPALIDSVAGVSESGRRPRATGTIGMNHFLNRGAIQDQRGSAKIKKQSLQPMRRQKSRSLFEQEFP
jgi:hypothetical protein